MLKSGLDVAETEKDKHRQALKSQRPQSIPGFGGGTIQLPAINLAAHEGLVQRVGPGAAAERKASETSSKCSFPATDVSPGSASDYSSQASPSDA